LAAVTRTTTCTYHCSACHVHFHSLESFDAHRTGPWERRRCIDPAGSERFASLTSEGRCDTYPRSVDHRAVVWTLGNRGSAIGVKRLTASEARG
jgi:hypothetical protein